MIHMTYERISIYMHINSDCLNSESSLTDDKPGQHNFVLTDSSLNFPVYFLIYFIPENLDPEV